VPTFGKYESANGESTVVHYVIHSEVCLSYRKSLKKLFDQDVRLAINSNVNPHCKQTTNTKSVLNLNISQF